MPTTNGLPAKFGLVARKNNMKLLQPDVVLGGNVLSLTPALIRDHGLRGLVLDIDDTIVPVKTTEVSPEIVAWLTEIRQDCKIWLVTNNPQRKRIATIANSLDLPYLLSAAKPSSRKLRQAVEDMALPYAQVAMVGDRIFTDVLGGNRLGLLTILAQPIESAASTSSFHLLRQIEFGLARMSGVSLVTTIRR
jgi:uncharacterized protein